MLKKNSDIRIDIDKLYNFLKSQKITALARSHFENDYLIALNYLDEYDAGNQSKLTSEGRASVGGLNELFKWIWSVKDCPEFNKLIPHMQMMSESAVKINSLTPMISPVTGKQDDKTNKLGS